MAKKKKKQEKKATGRFAKIAIPVLTAAIMGSIICNYRSRQTDKRSRQEISGTLREGSSWREHTIPDGVPVLDFYKYSESCRAIIKNYEDNPLDADKILSRFLRPGRYEDYNLEYLNCVIQLSRMAFTRLAEIHNRLYPTQNRLMEVGTEAMKLKRVPDEEAFPKLLDMAYFLTRSTYRSGNLDVFADNLEKRLRSGEGDCETNTIMTFLNFGRLAEAAGKGKLIERLRIADGIQPLNLGNGHVWLEAYLDRWEALECNGIEDNELISKEFNPARNYRKRVTVPPDFKKNYVKLTGLVYRYSGRGKVTYNQLIFILPADVEKEMGMNGWTLRTQSASFPSQN